MTGEGTATLVASKTIEEQVAEKLKAKLWYKPQSQSNKFFFDKTSDIFLSFLYCHFTSGLYSKIKLHLSFKWLLLRRYIGISDCNTSLNSSFRSPMTGEGTATLVASKTIEEQVAEKLKAKLWYKPQSEEEEQENSADMFNIGDLKLEFFLIRDNNNLHFTF
jgi:hypothetical protein